MRSKARIKSHPLHPILVGFPVAFFFGALVFDSLGYFTQNQYWIHTSEVMNITGVITAIIAAIPGLIDYIYVVPPQSSAKKRATYHMIVNLTATMIFFIAWLLRDPPLPGIEVLILELAGVVMISLGGWMGGTLVYRNQIGVDHRYAEAGKWEELRLNEENGKVKIGKAAELKVNQMKLLKVGEKRLVLARTEDGLKAFDDRCSHKGGSLADGTLACGTVTCPWHGSQFNVSNGNVSAGPAEKGIATYEILSEDGELFLILRQPTPLTN